jgi:hypothetical protein
METAILDPFTAERPYMCKRGTAGGFLIFFWMFTPTKATPPTNPKNLFGVLGLPPPLKSSVCTCMAQRQHHCVLDVLTTLVITCITTIAIDPPSVSDF